MSIRKGSKIIAGTASSGSSSSTYNQNPDSEIRQIYDWIGTLQEYIDQDIDNTHPEWVCYVTDDVDIVMSGEKLKTIASNCIVEEPENIKLSLVNGVLTILAGSKVYIPDGFELDGVTRKFEEVVLDKNIAWDDAGLNVGTGTNDYMLTIATDKNFPWARNDRYFASFNINVRNKSIHAQLSAPDSSVIQTNSIWYDLTENLMKCTADAGQTWEVCNVCLPICIANITCNGGETSLPIINKITDTFSKFGFMDKVIFALPNLKLLIPDGRNEDGSLNNIEFVTDYVSVYNNAGGGETKSNFGFTDYSHDDTTHGNIFSGHPFNLVRSGKGFIEVDKLPNEPKGLDSTRRYYVKSENKFYEARQDTFEWEEQRWCVCGSFTYDIRTAKKGEIKSINPKDTIKIVDYNEYFEYKKESLDNKNIMEGITKIPQDIKVKEEPANHTITIRKGTKIYIPNGFEADGTTPHFDVKILDKDYIDNDYTGSKKVYAIYNKEHDSINTAYVNSTSGSGGSTSGTGAIPTTSTNIHSLYYKIDTNKLYFITKDGDVEKHYECSLPLYIEEIDNTNNRKHIRHLLNGWGNVGGMVYVLPGLEFVTPNGRNEDGTCNNLKRVVDHVLLGDFTNRAYDYFMISSTFALYCWYYSDNLYYDYYPVPKANYWYIVIDTNKNMMFRSDNGGAYYQVSFAFLGMYSHEYNSAESFKAIAQRPAFTAVDMHDIKNIINMMYPVGSVYLEANNLGFCPIQRLLPYSKWELVSTNMALWGGDGTNSTTTKAAGLPNITGNLVFESLGDKATGIGGTGAFTLNITTQGNDSWGHDGTYGRKHSVNFNASRSSGIYGKSTTVQPPAYVVNVWRRTY